MKLSQRLPHRSGTEAGYTMVELLAVLAVLGILAAIALATLSGQDRFAMDAEAKSNVRNLFTHVQSCFVEQEDYTLCDEADEIGWPAGFAWGSGPGEVEIRRGGLRTTRSQITIRGFSDAVTDGSRHAFTFVKRTGPPPDTRTCETGGGNDAGGCNAGTW